MIVANTPGVLALKAAITTTPIVFTTGSDPVQIGLVASMNRPGGNVTGATAIAVGLAPKRLELVHELVPTASVIAALINPTNRNTAEPQLRHLQAAAHTLGLQLRIVHASTERDFDSSEGVSIKPAATSGVDTSCRVPWSAGYITNMFDF